MTPRRVPVAVLTLLAVALFASAVLIGESQLPGKVLVIGIHLGGNSGALLLLLGSIVLVGFLPWAATRRQSHMLRVGVAITSVAIFVGGCAVGALDSGRAFNDCVHRGED